MCFFLCYVEKRKPTIYLCKAFHFVKLIIGIQLRFFIGAISVINYDLSFLLRVCSSLLVSSEDFLYF